MWRRYWMILGISLLGIAPHSVAAIQEDPFEAVSSLGSDKYFKACEKLEDRVDFIFDDATSEDLKRFLKAQTGFDMKLGDSVIRAGLNPRQRFSIQLRNVSLRTGLQLLLRKYRATYVVQDGKILIHVDETRFDDPHYVQINHDFEEVVELMIDFIFRAQSELEKRDTSATKRETPRQKTGLVRPVIVKKGQSKRDELRELLTKQLFKLVRQLIDPRRLPEGKLTRAGAKFTLRSDSETHFLVREIQRELKAIYAGKLSELRHVKRRHRLFRALTRPASLDMRKNLVASLPGKVQKQLGVPVHVDHTAIDAGFSVNDEIKFFLMQDQPFSLAFEQYLQIYQLGYSMTSDAVVISHIDHQSEYDIVKFYDLRGTLLRLVQRRIKHLQSFRPATLAGKKRGIEVRKIWNATEAVMVNAIRRSVRPDEWKIVDGDRCVGLVAGVLAVKACPEMHRVIGQLIKEFREHSKSQTTVADVPSANERAGLRDALNKKVEKPTANVRLRSGVEQFSKRFQKRVFLDRSAVRRELSFTSVWEPTQKIPNFATYFREIAKSKNCKVGIWNGQLLIYSGPDFDFHETTVYDCRSTIERRCDRYSGSKKKSWQDFERELIRQVKTEIKKDLGDSYWDEGRHIGCVNGLVIIHASGVDHLRFARLLTNMK